MNSKSKYNLLDVMRKRYVASSERVLPMCRTAGFQMLSEPLFDSTFQVLWRDVPHSGSHVAYPGNRGKGTQ